MPDFVLTSLPDNFVYYTPDYSSGVVFNLSNIVNGGTIYLPNNINDGESFTIQSTSPTSLSISIQTLNSNIYGNVNAISSSTTVSYRKSNIINSWFLYNISGSNNAVDNQIIFDKANAAFNQANNEPIGTAAFLKANSANILAQVVFTQSNSVWLEANASFNQANASYNQANTVFNQSNNVWLETNAAFDKANSYNNLAEFKVYNESMNNVAISGSSITLNLANSGVFYVNLNASITTVTITNIPTYGKTTSFVLILNGDGTQRTIVWPAAVRWPLGTAPTITSTLNKVDVYTFFTYDSGVNIFGFISGQNL